MSTSHPIEPILQAVIPAAGRGTRLRPLTDAIPKEMLPVGRIPVLEHVTRELRLAGVTRALFVVSPSKPQVRTYFGDTFGQEGDEMPALQCSYIVQEEPLGLGHALILAKEWTQGEQFAVAFGDCIIQSDRTDLPLRRMLDLHRAAGSSATTLLETVTPDLVSRYGIVKPVHQDFDASVELADIVEKPRREEAPSCYAVAARWVLSADIFAYLESAELDQTGEVNLTDAVRRCKRAGGSLWAAKLGEGEARLDIGNYGSYFQAFVRAAIRDADYGALASVAALQEISARSETR